MKHMTSYPTLHPSSFKSDGKGKTVQESGRKKKVRIAVLAEILYGLLHCAKELGEDLGFIQEIGSH